jgi:hypothetical protein
MTYTITQTKLSECHHRFEDRCDLLEDILRSGLLAVKWRRDNERQVQKVVSCDCYQTVDAIAMKVAASACGCCIANATYCRILTCLKRHMVISFVQYLITT